jgi:hypothetical protein
MDGEMPKSKSPKMVEIRFSVPATYVKQAEAIASYEGRSEAALHRLIWEKGLAKHNEDMNKILVNQQLRLKVKPPEGLDDDSGDPDEDE